MTTIKITIDELVLDGAAAIDQSQLAQAIQQALAGQVAARGLPPAVHVPQVRQDVDSISAETVAGQIARSIYGGQK